MVRPAANRCQSIDELRPPVDSSPGRLRDPALPRHQASMEPPLSRGSRETEERALMPLEASIANG